MIPNRTLREAIGLGGEAVTPVDDGGAVRWALQCSLLRETRADGSMAHWPKVIAIVGLAAEAAISRLPRGIRAIGYLMELSHRPLPWSAEIHVGERSENVSATLSAELLFFADRAVL